jgi:hypothetical protein
MGRVFLAEDPDIQRKVAIKTIQVFSNLPESERAEARERFTREARSAGKLLHPGIVTLFDVGEHKGIPYLAMELVKGDALDHHCRKEALLPVATVLDIIGQVAQALGYAHSEGIVHRDIKPSNLMLVGGRTVKIMDFGLAKAPAAHLTSDGTLMGTPGYMAPEQIRGGTIDGRSDLFALGCVLFEMLTGKKAFDGDTISAVVYRVVHDDPPDLSKYQERVTPEMEQILKKALSKDPDQRFPDGAAFAAALSAMDAAAPSATQPVDARAATGQTPTRTDEKVELPPAVRGRTKRKSPSALVPILIVLLLGLAGAGYAFRKEIVDLYNGKPFSELFGSTAGPPADEATPEPPVAVPPSGSGLLTAMVRTDPAGLPVLLNGEAVEGNQVEFPAAGPFGTLSASQECRSVQYVLDPRDGGQEVVLVLDPLHLNLIIPAPVDGTVIRLNGGQGLPAPADIKLDLCMENIIEFDSAGYHKATRTVAAGSTPLEARTAISGVTLEPVPLGIVELPTASYPLVVRVDGTRAAKGVDSLELPEGEHKIRLTNERYWIDVTAKVTVVGGETRTPFSALPRLAELTVLAYPPNCKVYLAHRSGGKWRYVENTPLSGYKIASGSYRIRVELINTGAVKDQELKLNAGPNPPVRVSFGGQQ